MTPLRHLLDGVLAFGHAVGLFFLRLGFYPVAKLLSVYGWVLFRCHSWFLLACGFVVYQVHQFDADPGSAPTAAVDLDEALSQLAQVTESSSAETLRRAARCFATKAPSEMTDAEWSDALRQIGFPEPLAAWPWHPETPYTAAVVRNRRYGQRDGKLRTLVYRDVRLGILREPLPRGGRDGTQTILDQGLAACRQSQDRSRTVAFLSHALPCVIERQQGEVQELIPYEPPPATVDVLIELRRRATAALVDPRSGEP